MSLSVDDVLVLWQAAKKLGAHSILVNGIEIEFLQREPEVPRSSGSLSTTECPHCGEILKMNRYGKLYCYNCWKNGGKRSAK